MKSLGIGNKNYLIDTENQVVFRVLYNDWINPKRRRIVINKKECAKVIEVLGTFIK